MRVPILVAQKLAAIDSIRARSQRRPPAATRPRVVDKRYFWPMLAVLCLLILCVGIGIGAFITVRRLRAADIREKKKRDNHAKIVIGVAMIWKCQSSPPSAEKFKELLAEFYADSPERLNAAIYGLTIAVKKPENDQEQD